MVKVVIEYCGGWGYGPRYQELAAQITKAVPDAEVTGVIGRRTSFEVTVDDSLIHSKLTTMKFPDFDEVVEIVKNCAAGSEPEKVTKHQPGMCTIL